MLQYLLKNNFYTMTQRNAGLSSAYLPHMPSRADQAYPGRQPSVYTTARSAIATVSTLLDTCVSYSFPSVDSCFVISSLYQAFAPSKPAVDRLSPATFSRNLLMSPMDGERE